MCERPGNPMRLFRSLAIAVGLVTVLCPPSWAQYEQSIPWLGSGSGFSSGETPQGFVRIVNRSARAGAIDVIAIDDSAREFGPVRVTVEAGAAVAFRSRDLESGNPAIGIARGIGTGEGDWRLLLRSELNFQATAFALWDDGFVTGAQALARATLSGGQLSGYHVPTFNPAGNQTQRSTLRLVNTSDRLRNVTVRGFDDRGVPAPGGEVRVSLEAGESRTLTAGQLEAGATDLVGSLGTGNGRWRLLVSAEPDVLAMSLLRSLAGHSANISRGGAADALNLDDPEVRDSHSIPLFLAAGDSVRDGLARIVNHSERPGVVTIRAVDDAGRRFGPVSFNLAGRATAEFDSEDLERGSPRIGLSRGVGNGRGDWRLELQSSLPIEAMAYVRMADGLLTDAQDIADTNGDVPMFNPASDSGPQSSLRLVNTLDAPAQVSIEAIDDRGRPAPGGLVRLTLPAAEARTLTSRQLEQGGEGLIGRLGDGAGRWRLAVSAPEGVVVMGLLESPMGRLSNLSGGAAAEPLRHADRDGDGISDYEDAFPGDPERQARENGISTTLDHQIVMELLAEDTVPARLFDLGGQTLLFRPVGDSGYVRSVEPLAWEDELGAQVHDAGVAFGSFEFPYAGSNWDSFHVNRNGNITFGQALGSPLGSERFAQLRVQGDGFTKGLSTISALYKPYVLGHRYVNRLADRVVVTWTVSEDGGIEAFSPSPEINEFQAVLFADGRIAFNYRDVSMRDGIVGLFPEITAEPVQGNRLITLRDPVNPDLTEHIDLVEVAVFDADQESLIVEFATQGPPPQNGDASVDGLVYSFFLDVDAPLLDRIDWSDVDYNFRISGGADDRFTVSTLRGDAAAARMLSAEGEPGRIRIAISIPGFEGGTVAAFAEALRLDSNGKLDGFDHTRPAVLQLPAFASRAVDLSTYGEQALIGYEAFHFRGLPDPDELTCRLIRTLGDGFKFVIFASEFRVDQQSFPGAMRRFGEVSKGLGLSDRPNQRCSEGTLKGFINYPIYMNSEMGRGAGPPGLPSNGFNYALSLLGHEMGHLWTVGAAYDADGERERLYNEMSSWHWRWELHAPTVFPWLGDRQASTMGGGYWQENSDGTFTRLADGYFVPAPGFSHLDLYLMGLLDASEVPDTFLVQAPVLLNRDGGFEIYSATKETISIDRVVAALGPREAATGIAENEFNVAFVYLVEPGRTPGSLPLQRHAAMRDTFAEYWAHVTGGRSQITTEARFDSSVGFVRAPLESGSRPPGPVRLSPHFGNSHNHSDHTQDAHFLHAHE